MDNPKPAAARIEAIAKRVQTQRETLAQATAISLGGTLNSQLEIICKGLHLEFKQLDPQRLKEAMVRAAEEPHSFGKALIKELASTFAPEVEEALLQELERRLDDNDPVHPTVGSD